MKKYEYKGKIYSNYDLSEQIENFGGDLWALYSVLEDDNLAQEIVYYVPIPCESSMQIYDDPDELIEAEFDYLEVKE